MSAANLGGFIWPGAMLALSIVGLVVVCRVFRRLLFGASSIDSSPSWGLEELRQLRERGQISQEEYDRLRRAAAAAVAGSVQNSKSRSSGFRDTDSGVDLLAGGGWMVLNAEDGSSHHPHPHSGDGGMGSHHGGEPTLGDGGDFGGAGGGADFGSDSDGGGGSSD